MPRTLHSQAEHQMGTSKFVGTVVGDIDAVGSSGGGTKEDTRHSLSGDSCIRELFPDIRKRPCLAAAQRNVELLRKSGLLELELARSRRNRKIRARSLEDRFIEREVSFERKQETTTTTGSIVSLYSDPDLLTINDSVSTWNRSEAPPKKITPIYLNSPQPKHIAAPEVPDDSPKLCTMTQHFSNPVSQRNEKRSNTSPTADGYSSLPPKTSLVSEQSAKLIVSPPPLKHILVPPTTDVVADSAIVQPNRSASTYQAKLPRGRRTSSHVLLPSESSHRSQNNFVTPPKRSHAAHHTSQNLNVPPVFKETTRQTKTLPPQNSEPFVYGKSCRHLTSTLQGQPAKKMDASKNKNSCHISDMRTFMGRKTSNRTNSWVHSRSQLRTDQKTKAGLKSNNNKIKHTTVAIGQGSKMNVSYERSVRKNILDSKKLRYRDESRSTRRIHETSCSDNYAKHRESKTSESHQSQSHPKQLNQKMNKSGCVDYSWILTQKDIDTKFLSELLGRTVCWALNDNAKSFSSEGSYMTASLASTVSSLIDDGILNVATASNSMMVATVAAVVIQTQVRRLLGRFVALDRMCAVIVCQAYCRCCFYQKQFQISKVSSVRIQSVFRAYVERFWKGARLYCASRVQSAARIWIAKKRIEIIRSHEAEKTRKLAATRLQSFQRGFWVRLCLDVDHYCATQVQRFARRVLAYRKLCKLRRRLFYFLKKVLLIQFVVRRKIDRNFDAQLRQSIVLVQKCWRGFKTRLFYKFVLYDIITIQCSVRFFIAKVKRKLLALELLDKTKSITCIQKSWRVYTARLFYKLFLYDIRTIQSYVRSYIAHIKRQRLNQDKNKKVTLIQACWRAYMAKLLYKFLLYDITSFQSLVRCFIEKIRVDWKRKAKSATRIQNFWRSYVLRLCYQLLIYDVLTIQAFARVLISKIRANRQRRTVHDVYCATLIQRCWRRVISKLYYQFVLHDIINIQARVRCYINEVHFNKNLLSLYTNEAAACIQKWWKCHLSSICYKFVLYDIITIQVHARCFIAKLQLRRKLKQSQSISPPLRAATLIQQSWRTHVCRLDFIYQIACVMLIQSVTRGRITRKAFYSYTEGYRRFGMSSPFRRSRTEGIETEQSLPEERFLRYLLRRNILWKKDQALTFLRNIPSRFR